MADRSQPPDPPPASPQSTQEPTRDDTEAARAARRLVEELETGGRLPSGVLLWGIIGLSLGWSLFQLGVASVLAVDVIIQRAVHVFCGITLAFLVFPAIRGRRRPGVFQLAVLGGLSLGVGYAAVRLVGEVTPLSPPHWLALAVGLALAVAVLWSLRGEQIHHVPWFDLLFALMAGLGALYLVFDYQGLQARQGLAIEREIWIGLLFMLLLLEATRRSLGPALAVIAGLFFLYQLSGPRGAIPWLAEWMPDLLAHRGASLQRAISHQYVTTEGIFGVPVGVSTAFVFLFVLFGSMLDKAGAGKYFIDVANSFLGHLRGGPAKAAVVASGLTGMVSGSSLANVVTTGTFTIPLMKRTGYPAYKAGACEVAVSTNGQLMPPVMGAAAFIIAEFVGVPYIEVIRAAAIPAFVAYFALFYIMHLEALKLGLHGIPRDELPPRLRTFLGGLHFLIPVTVLVHYLVIEQRTPGYAVMVAILTLAVLMLVQEPVKAVRQGRPLAPALWHGVVTLFQGLLAGARNMVGIAVAVATAGIIVGSVSQTGVGLRLTEIIQILSAAMASGIGLVTLPVVDFFGGDVTGFDTTTQFAIVLLITAVASLILGLGLPTTANYVVMATLTAPVIYQLGNEFGFGIPLLAAHLFVFFFGILADDTPPVGLAAYAAAGIARSNPIRTGIQGFIYDMRTAILPFMFIFNTQLLQINVESWLQIVHIFASALVGMMAFAAGVQGFVRIRTILPERLVLLGVAFMLIQPNWFTDILGVSLYALVYLSQWYRRHRRTGVT
ncbi:TRAP transporter permease [Halomonas sp. M4R1S46]|uniref:TRAP transporter permease n=1 Tax=Halomonas sp. M4R1S46 TaxID=2982692 RepID=UPI0021E3B891|nr:TRAP transporter permease [Halomonas sp. M4R1S46]UYG09100.1 TRAP transporter permease [Halomonas sp. M4R1S46]